MTHTTTHAIPTKEFETVVIRFAGDSGDGMQLTGSQFTNTSALLGNDIHTFPDFPAEIRAPAGTLPGVSGFQLSFSSKDIHTAGDSLHALVAMNPAGLKVNLADLEEGGLLIVNSNAFEEKDLKKAQYTHNPLETDELSKYRVFTLPITELTLNAVNGLGLSHSQSSKCKNMFALGILFWLYTRPLDYTTTWLAQKFQAHPEIANANIAALKAGFNYALTAELFSERYTVRKAALKPGRYRQITGNEALGLGCIAAATKAERPLLLSGYPITPASAILSQLAKYAQFGVSTFQAEDEIAAICASIGAAFGGSLAVTSTSGPGLDLKEEALGLAVMTELPLVLIDVQRAGPSTGLPTKTEQADLLTAMYGRHGECPLPILAPASPGDCFHIAVEAFRLALKYMTPVIILSDGYLANGAEPWPIPDVNALPDLKPIFHTDPQDFTPYARNPDTLARVWAIPGTPGLEHRLGGLEKDKKTGNISYEPINHHEMVAMRLEKIQRIANDIPELEVLGPKQGKVLVVSWGGTYGTVLSAVEELQNAGQSVSFIHLRHMNPFPKNLGDILRSFETVLVPELNLGQLCKLLRAEFLVDAKPYSKVTGKPFLISEIRQKILTLL
jgi:2-oxoglutarate/2-oxoacid ferredoxin oxidoreductase subunit alpha